MNEAYVERKYRAAVQAKLGLCLKLVTPGFTGIPDRLILMPLARLWFAEFKYGTGKLSPRQTVVIGILRGLGFTVLIINEKNVDEEISKL